MNNGDTYSKPFADLCRAAYHSPESTKLSKIYAASIPIVILFAVAAVASFYFFYKWHILDPIRRKLVWQLHGRLCGLICCCSALGVPTWTSFAFEYYNSVLADSYIIFNSSDAKAQAAASYLDAVASEWQIAFNVLYPIEFLFLSLVQTIIFTRLTKVVSSASKSAVLKRRINLLYRVVRAIVLASCIVGICSNIPTNVRMYEVAQAYRKEGDAWSNGDAAAAAAARDERLLAEEHAQVLSSIQIFAEIVAMLAIFTSYITSGFYCIQIQKAASSATSNQELAKHDARMKSVRRQILITVFVTFVSLLLRTVFAFLNGLSSVLYRSQKTRFSVGCSSSDEDPCADCNSQWEIIDSFLAFSPNFQCWITFVAEPMTLLVSLWGMIASRTRDILFKARRQEPQSIVSLDTISWLQPESTKSVTRSQFSGTVDASPVSESDSNLLPKKSFR